VTHVIAIDGPSGSGKSSTSRGVASTLGYAYLDTGAMYRAMTWAMLQRGVDVHDAEAVASASAEVVLASGTDPQHPTIEADGVDVSEPIRGDEVTGAVSPVATVPEVRRQLVDLQRKLIAEAGGGIVVEGRDIGTVVAPDAALKVYLVADPVARARRRALELGVEDAEAMREALARRDAIDSNRKTAPLAQAEDAIVVDGTDLTLDEVIDRIVALAQR
jgi:cytidylate kinase